MNSGEKLQGTESRREVVCPKCGDKQLTVGPEIFKTILNFLIFPFLLVGMLILPMAIQIGIGTWLGKKTKCRNCGEVVRATKERNQT